MFLMLLQSFGQVIHLVLHLSFSFAFVELLFLCISLFFLIFVFEISNCKLFSFKMHKTMAMFSNSTHTHLKLCYSLTLRLSSSFFEIHSYDWYFFSIENTQTRIFTRGRSQFSYIFVTKYFFFFLSTKI